MRINASIKVNVFHLDARVTNLRVQEKSNISCCKLTNKQIEPCERKLST